MAEKKKPAETGNETDNENTANIHNSNELQTKSVNLFSGDAGATFRASKTTKNLHETLSLPTWGFPKFIQNIIDEVSEVYQVSKNIVIAQVVSVVGAAVGKRISSFDGTYTNYANGLWLLYVMRNGGNKTETSKFITKPISDRTVELADEWESAKKYSDEKSTPELKRLEVGMITLEDLLARLKAYPSVLMYDDDCGGFFNNINRTTKGDNVSTWLRLFSNSTILYDTKTQGHYTIKEPAVGILGGIQPEVLADCFKEYVRLNNGFVQRFNFVYDFEKPIPYPNGKHISKKTKDLWDDYIKGLVDGRRTDYATRNVFQNIYDDEVKLTYTDESAAILLEYKKKLIDKINDTDNDYVRGIYSKLIIQAERWALVTAIMDDERKGWHHIEPEHIRFAIESMEYFEYTALKVYDLIRQPERPISIADCIRGLKGKIMNQSMFAESIGVSQPYINKLINDKK